MNVKTIESRFLLGEKLFNFGYHRHVSFYDQNGHVRLWLWLVKPLQFYPEDWCQVALKLRHPTDFSFKSSKCFITQYTSSIVIIEGYIDKWPFIFKLYPCVESEILLYRATFDYGSKSTKLFVFDKQMALNTYLIPITHHHLFDHYLDKIWYNKKHWKFVKWDSESHKSIVLKREYKKQSHIITAETHLCQMIVHGHILEKYNSMLRKENASNKLIKNKQYNKQKMD